MKKIFVIAGEASGDLHASNLVQAMDALHTELQWQGWGGDKMTAAGVEVVKHYKELSFMGFLEVVKNLGTIQRNFKTCKSQIEAFKPDAVILVDYPGFNLRMAKFIKRLGIKVFYYISPQLWAWNASRVKTIKRYADAMAVILPFEKSFYEKRNVKVEYVGHPLLDELKTFEKGPDFYNNSDIDDRKIVALLPGSRKQEITKMLPTMTAVANQFKDYQFIIAGLKRQQHLYEDYLNEQIKVVYDQTYQILTHAKAALVASGTATLETALFNVPQVVCYKANALSIFIAKRLANVKYISLVNLIMDKEVVKELIQKNFNVKELQLHLEGILINKSLRADLKSDYRELKTKLGNEGASNRAAKYYLDLLY